MNYSCDFTSLIKDGNVFLIAPTVGAKGQDKKLRMQTEARWLHPLDDVATALRTLKAGDTSSPCGLSALA